MLLAAGNQVNGNETQDKPTGSDVKKTSTVVKEFVVDFSREDYKPLMEHEVNGLTYRYVNSDKARLSVVVQGIETGSSSLLDEKGELHAYYHTDYLGTTDYLTSAVNSKVISWTSYNEWGEITHNAVLKCGKRELDLVKEYATHDYDAVLDLYYAKARFYDAYNRTFTAQDPILDPSQYDLREYVKEPMALVQYLYVRDNAVNLIDILGLYYVVENESGNGYHAVPQSDILTVSSSIAGLFPGGGGALSALIKQIAGGSAVGGNSMHDVQPLSEYLTDEAKSALQKAILETSFGGILGGSINEGIGLAKAFTFWDDLADEATLLRNDQAAFNLFELADMDITGATVEEVEYKMSAAISYARSNAWFFTNSTHQTWQKNWTGSIQYTNYPSAFMNLLTLQHMKNEGTAESEIQEQINSYWSVFGCSQVVAINSHIGYTNTTLKNAIIIYEQARPAPYAGTVLVIEPYYHYALTHYDDELSVIGNSFSEYMELMMDAYTK